MAGYGKFQAAIMSRAEYDTEGVGYSTVMEDYPMVLGPLAIVGPARLLRMAWCHPRHMQRRQRTPFPRPA